MSSIREPAISVVMPVYNAGEYLRPAIDSILGQTFTDFELILVNDGSTDGSDRIIEDAARRDERVKVISRENRGLVISLNEGIGLARGELIARMDADDLAWPERFALQKNYLDGHPQVICVGSKVRVIDDKNRFLTHTRPRLTHAEIVDSALNGVSPVIHPSALIRKAALEQVGGYKAQYYPAEDLALWIELSEVGELANLDLPLLDYRIHDNSISTSRHETQQEITATICREACERRNLPFNNRFRVGRGGESPDSKHEIVVRHGWWAFGSKQWNTTTIYGLKAIRLAPFKPEGWKLLACSWFRRSE